MNKKIQHFNIAFYAMIMGFAGFSLASMKFQHVLHLMFPLGNIFLFLTSFLFALVSIFYGIKFLQFPQEVQKDFLHPVKSNFFPGIGKIFLILAIGFFEISREVSLWLWILGASIQFIFTLVIFRRWILEEMDIKILNPLWFLPIVGNMIVPIAGVRLGYIEISWFFFSVGIIMWGILMTILMNRILFHHPLPEKLFPTLTILIAPPVVAMISLTTLLGGEITPIAKIFYYFGLFLFFLLSTKIPLLRKIPFYMSWWALSFPLAVLTTGTFLMYEKLHLGGFLILAIFLSFLLCLLMLYLSFQTIRAAKIGTICTEE